LGIFGVLALFLVGLPAYKVYQEGMKTYEQAKIIKEVAKEQDIVKIIDGIEKTKAQLLITQTASEKLNWVKNIPFAGGYIADMNHLIKSGLYGLEAGEIAAKAVEPYSDLLGLKGKGTFTGGTTEDRIATAIATLEKVTPQIDTVAEKLKLVKAEIDQVDPKRYPENFKGKPIRETLVQARMIVDQASILLDEARPLVKVLPKHLGQPNEVKYLVIFQNDAELRPTGGFMTAYAVFRMQKGKINIDTADDIYKLDSTVTKNVKPPQAITDYLNESVWHLRNTNFSPDFPTSMKNFMTLYQSSPEKKTIAGIITMDTQLLVKLMEVLGPVSAYGINFTTDKVPQCDCPQIIWELEKYADEPTPYLKKDRKDIIGVLLQAVMQKAMKAPKNLWAPLITTGFTASQEKHLLVYLFDENAQKGIEALGMAGNIKTYNGDYLHINDANLGGAKSNLYITQNVKEEVTTGTTGTQTTLTIEYRHPRRADNCSLERKSGVCLSGILRDYVRVYLPQGAQVQSVTGFEIKGTKLTKGAIFEDLGKTVIDGFFTVVPLGLARIQIKYTTPTVFTKEYRQLIQKQPGTDNNHYKVTVNGKTEEFDLSQDRELVMPL
ncbi:MAG: DUF4012 domain-containing protein, partial [bacterium]|nr:DUF4012 domain-containing protein [bacterium]